MLFSKETYVERRQRLCESVSNGLIVLFGNNESPMNYPANAYKYRQDSTFLYFFGEHRSGLAALLDAESGEVWLAGDEIDIDDIVWYGSVHSVKAMAEETGAKACIDMATFEERVKQAAQAGRRIHFLPPYRHDTMLAITDLLGIHHSKQREAASLELIHAVVKLRSLKSEEEIVELEKASAIGYKMHTAAMRLCRPGVTEQYIGGVLEGIALAYGSHVSFQSIVSMHGEILHGYPSATPLEKGRLLLCDAGAETNENYCSDHTRTSPIGGKFSTRQREIHDIVADCHDLALSHARPGVRWWDVHYAVCRLMTDRLKELGLMKGDTEESVRAGAHALFLPHGLGHMMGMDVHDMEGLGQIHVGYDEETRPSSQFGINALRFARKLEVGHVVTDEPGIYFIPDLIDLWQREGINSEFLCFDKINEYRDFGGVRIEDDVLITPDGCRFLGEETIPYRALEVENYMAEHADASPFIL